MQLQPAAFVYLALQRMGAALIIGLMIGVFAGGLMGGGAPPQEQAARQPGLQVAGHAHAPENANARATPPAAPSRSVRPQAYVNWPAFITMGVFAVLSFPAVLLYAWFLARSYRIELRPDGLSLEYGIVTTTSELMLYGKIEDIVISQGLLGRLMSLVTVKIQNAMGRPQIIAGCSRRDAEMLRDAASARARPA